MTPESFKMHFGLQEAIQTRKDRLQVHCPVEAYWTETFEEFKALLREHTGDDCYTQNNTTGETCAGKSWTVFSAANSAEKHVIIFSPAALQPLQESSASEDARQREQLIGRFFDIMDHELGHCKDTEMNPKLDRHFEQLNTSLRSQRFMSETLYAEHFREKALNETRAVFYSLVQSSETLKSRQNRTQELVDFIHNHINELDSSHQKFISLRETNPSDTEGIHQEYQLLKVQIFKFVGAYLQYALEIYLHALLSRSPVPSELFCRNTDFQALDKTLLEVLQDYLEAQFQNHSEVIFQLQTVQNSLFQRCRFEWYLQLTESFEQPTFSFLHVLNFNPQSVNKLEPPRYL